MPGEPNVLTAQQFENIQRMAYDRFGLNLTSNKRSLVESRVEKLLRDEGEDSFGDYWRRVETDSTGESLIALVNVLTTNFTTFLREPQHFQFLERRVVPELGANGSLNVWSAACSTGEEPYSIAFTLAASGKVRNFQIAATDISTRALRIAERGVYSGEAVADLPAAWKPQFLLKGEGSSSGLYQVKAPIRERVRTRRFNLLSDPLPQERYALIFCRNVMIYFDTPTKERVIRRLSECILPGGYLFVGHSESLLGVKHGLDYVQPAVYQKPETSA